MSVEKALSALEGVTKVEVSLEKKQAIIESEQVVEKNKIKEAGFEVKNIK